MSNRPSSSAVSALFAAGALGTPAFGQWVTSVDETATRIVAEPSRGISDVEEKRYSWGDVDLDGDIDLAVSRKEPGFAAGKRSKTACPAS